MKPAARLNEAYMWNPQEHSDSENLRWCYLRAIEWASWPAYLSQAIAPLALVFASSVIVLGTAFGLNILWVATVRYRFVSVRAADFGFFVVLLRWLTCPAAAFYLWWTGEWVGALLALFWPLIAAVISAIPPTQVGVVQKQFMAKLGYRAVDTSA
jgi:hypothetical protein